MHTRIQKWGNSQGLRLTKDLLESVHIEVGDEVDVRAKDGFLIIAPARKIRGRYKIEDLVDRIPEDYQPEELDWGGPSGREAW